MKRIASLRRNLDLLAPDEWDGDPSIHGVVYDWSEGKAWEVPIGEALARGFRLTDSQVKVAVSANVKPWTPGDEEPFEKWWGEASLSRMGLGVLEDFLGTPSGMVTVLFALLIVVGALIWVGNLGGGVGWAVLFAGLVVLAVYAWRRRR